MRFITNIVSQFISKIMKQSESKQEKNDIKRKALLEEYATKKETEFDIKMDAQLDEETQARLAELKTAAHLHSFYAIRNIADIDSYIQYDDPFTAGILIADYEQQLAREYILNYVDIFNHESDCYIDFYIPGYEKTNGDSLVAFSIGEEKYRFNRELFNEAIMDLGRKGIKYQFCPLLILQEFEEQHMTGRRIVIELQTDKAGMLFEDIFRIAKREIDIEVFSRELKKRQIKQLMPKIVKEIIKKLTGSMLVEVIVDNTDVITQYRIKER